MGRTKAVAIAFTACAWLTPAAAQGRQDAPLITLEYRKGYTKGAYSAFAFAFAAGQDLVVHRDYDAVWSLKPPSFPNGSTLDWYVPAGTIPNGKGVWGIFQLAFGNYAGTHHQMPVPPRKVSELDSFKTTFDWSYSGSANFNLLHEFFVTRAPQPQPQPIYGTDGTIEIGVFLHLPPITRIFHEKGARIGPDHVNGGVTYSVRRNKDYITFAPVDFREQLSGAIDWKAALDYLVAQKVITGSEYINGAGFGVEPTIGGGKGQMTVHSLDITFR